MSQSLVSSIYHIVFSTKDRRCWFEDKEDRVLLHAYLTGIAKHQKCPAIIVGGVADHVHILCRFNKHAIVPKLVQELKRSSSLWMKSKGDRFSEFSWQSGYGAFSLSESLVEPSRKYIVQQETHHLSFTFQEEYLRILKKANIEYNPMYIWD